MNTATNPRTRHQSSRSAREDGGRPGARPTANQRQQAGGDAGAEEHRAGPADQAAKTPGRPRRRLQSGPGCRRPARHGRAPAPGHGHYRLPRPPRTPGNLERRPARHRRGTVPPGLTGTGTLAFTGPVTAATVRKIACDADIIPVLLGTQGRILDIGRTSRVFPPHIRKAITARDQGCAFPGCTIPAPWCEAHHINYWSQGGTTTTDNGALLCTHHHHLIHKEQWQIQISAGIPWFIPPPHIDPRPTAPAQPLLPPRQTSPPHA